MAFFLPIGLTVVGIIITIVAYTNMRQGGARVYTLEREAILRRAGAAMFLGMGIFVLTIAWLLYQQQLLTAVDEDGEEAAPAVAVEASDDTAVAADESTAVDAPTATPVPEGTLQIPQLEVVQPTATIDPSLPTPTPTPIVVRAFVINTGGNGLTMRDVPGGEQVLILQEEEFVTVLEEEGTADVNGLIWVKIRTFLGDEGWVARDFLEIEGQP